MVDTSNATYNPEFTLTYTIVASDYPVNFDREAYQTTPTIVGYYDLNGKLINGKQRGTVIVRYSDGTTRKVLK